jgi:hypothetical protein
VSLFPYKPGSTGDPTNGVIPTSAGHGGLSTGAEIGIGVGAGLGALLLVLLAGVFCVCTRRKKKHAQLAQLDNVPPVDEKPSPSTNVTYKGQESPTSPGAYSSNHDSIYSGMSGSTFRPDTAPIYPQPISETLYVIPPGMHPIQHPVVMMPGYVPYQHSSPTNSPPAAELEGTYAHPTALGPVVNTWNVPNPSQGNIQYSPHGGTSPWGTGVFALPISIIFMLKRKEVEGVNGGQVHAILLFLICILSIQWRFEKQLGALSVLQLFHGWDMTVWYYVESIYSAVQCLHNQLPVFEHTKYFCSQTSAAFDCIYSSTRRRP